MTNISRSVEVLGKKDEATFIVHVPGEVNLREVQITDPETRAYLDGHIHMSVGGTVLGTNNVLSVDPSVPAAPLKEPPFPQEKGDFWDR